MSRASARWTRFAVTALYLHSPLQVQLPHVPGMTTSAAAPAPASLNKPCALYTWGDGSSGQLGHGDFESAPTPERVRALGKQRVVAASCGGEHTLVLVASGDVYSFGRAEDGALGRTIDSPADSAHPRVVDVLQNKSITSVAAGGRHSCALSVTGAVYTWGFGHDGQLANAEAALEGRGSSCTPRLASLGPIGTSAPAALAAGAHNTAFVLRNGTLATCGLGGPQLGHAKPTGPRDAPQRANPTLGEHEASIAAVALGELHMVVATQFGAVLACGSNARMQLGARPPPAGEAPAAQAEARPALAGAVVAERHVPTAEPTPDGDAAEAGAPAAGDGGGGGGGGRSAPPAPDGGGSPKARSGTGAKQRGLGLLSTIVSGETALRALPPWRLALPSKERVSAVACGAYHTLAVSAANGLVFSWGDGQAGQLGHGGCADEPRPRIVAALRRPRGRAGEPVLVRQRSSACALGGGGAGGGGAGGAVDRRFSGASAAAGGDGGGGSGGRAGPSPADGECLLSPCAAVGVGAGDWHSLVLMDDGTLYSFGANADGQLGTGIGLTRSCALPARVEALARPGLHVVAACAGGAFSAAVVAEGAHALPLSLHHFALAPTRPAAAAAAARNDEGARAREAALAGTGADERGRSGAALGVRPLPARAAAGVAADLGARAAGAAALGAPAPLPALGARGGGSVRGGGDARSVAAAAANAAAAPAATGVARAPKASAAADAPHELNALTADVLGERIGRLAARQGAQRSRTHASAQVRGERLRLARRAPLRARCAACAHALSFVPCAPARSCATFRRAFPFPPADLGTAGCLPRRGRACATGARAHRRGAPRGGRAPPRLGRRGRRDPHARALLQLGAARARARAQRVPAAAALARRPAFAAGRRPAAARGRLWPAGWHDGCAAQGAVRTCHCARTRAPGAPPQGRAAARRRCRGGGRLERRWLGAKLPRRARAERPAASACRWRGRGRRHRVRRRRAHDGGASRVDAAAAVRRIRSGARASQAANVIRAVTAAVLTM